MANSHFTLGLRLAKEKFLYFHDLTACNRICGARFFCVFNSSRAFGSNPLFRSFRLRSGVVSGGVFASTLSFFGAFFLSLVCSGGRLSGRRSVSWVNFAAGRLGYE